jgi:acyl-CoA reductase-like NAD-dependent aldehyde dehydrogenase
MLKTVNPATGRIVETYETHSDKGVEKIINATDKSWHQWRTTSFTQRGALMQNISTILRSRKEELARIMALEMGKVLREGIAEIENVPGFANITHIMLKVFWRMNSLKQRHSVRLLPTSRLGQFWQ